MSNIFAYKGRETRDDMFFARQRGGTADICMKETKKNIHYYTICQFSVNERKRMACGPPLSADDMGPCLA